MSRRWGLRACSPVRWLHQVRSRRAERRKWSRDGDDECFRRCWRCDRVEARVRRSVKSRETSGMAAMVSLPRDDAIAVCRAFKIAVEGRELQSGFRFVPSTAILMDRAASFTKLYAATHQACYSEGNAPLNFRGSAALKRRSQVQGSLLGLLVRRRSRPIG
jgi:hypothetical protein